MGILNFFRKKSNKQVIKNDIDNEINMLFNDKKYDEVIEMAATLFANDKEKISLDIKQKVALSYYYRTEYEKSLTMFEEIALKKNDIESWFNVLMSLMPSKKIQQGKEVFNKILKMHKGLNAQQPRELAIPFIRYYYACGLCDAGLFDDALEQLEELKKIYMELKITDDTFVYIRGVPFLSQTLDLAKKVFNGLGKDFSNSDFLKELIKKIDDDGKEMIKEYYER